jgi:hypothetical protein
MYIFGLDKRNMKTLLLLPFCLIFTLLNAQDIPEKIGMPVKDGSVEYELIDTVTASKDALYQAANSATVDIFRSSQSVIELQDKDAGLIKGKTWSIVKHKLGYGVTGSSRVDFTFEIQAKDDRYRIKLINWIGSLSDKEAGKSSVLEIYTKGIYKSAKYREWYLTGVNETALASLAVFKQSIKKKLQDTW